MKTTPKPPPAEPTAVPLREVERELTRRLRAVQGRHEDSPVVRACMSNLVVYCSGREVCPDVGAAIPDVMARHPARVLFLLTEPGHDPGNVTATVRVRGHVVEPGRWVCSEEVTLQATGRSVARLPSAVRTLQIGDLPTNLWWASAEPPPLAADRLYDLADSAEQVVYDSRGWAEPARDLVATAAWLERVERDRAPGRWRVASDLNWRRLKYWRRLLTQSLDPATAPGLLEAITDIQVEHGPHAVVKAWLMVSWLASRLGWRVRSGQARPGEEFAWHLDAAQGPVRVRVRRLADAPPSVRRVQITGRPGGHEAVLNLEVVEGEPRLAAVPDKDGAAPRTMTVAPQTLADLVGQQLADRGRDPAFRDSMAVARGMAQSVLGAV